MAVILITGATGKQGGSLVRNLVSRPTPFEILAVTRNAQSASAQKLSELSPKIKLVEGNLDDPAGIFANASKVTQQPIWGVFSVQANGTGFVEEEQGKALVDASLKENVKFFVYSSVDRGGDASFQTPTNIPHFIHKHKIEHHLVEKTKNTGMQWFILRPTAFFDNLTPDFLGKVFATSYKVSLKGRPLQMVATSDIGFFAAEGFLNPERYQGKGLSLAGDELTYDEFSKVFLDKVGMEIPTTFELISYGIMAVIKDLGYMFQWFHDEGYKANIPDLKEIYPGLKDFSSWLETESGFAKR